jgi:hypothetical protein
MRAILMLPVQFALAYSHPPEWTVLNDTDFVGNNIAGSTKTGSLVECAQLCLSIAGCAAASWNGPQSKFKDNNCNLHCRGDNPSEDSGEVGILVNRTNLCVGPAPSPPGQIPHDLREAYERADLLYASNEAEVRYRPEIGNGFVATVVGSDTLFAAGVFNGKAQAKDPSHRAAIPAPLALQVDGQVTGAALDLRGGFYLRRYSLNARASAQIRFYAHRVRRSLLVAELSVMSTDRWLVPVKLSGGPTTPSSKDFTWKSTQRTIGGRDVVLWSGETIETESTTGNRTRVAVVIPNDLTGTITLDNGTSIAYVCAVRTSLESEDPEGDALADWRAADTAGPAVLSTTHREAWAELWESGLEVTGRADVSRAVNSSLYYMLSSVREDAVHSLSPGGLASNGYNGHTFWDCETWMYPSLVLWHPRIAASLLQYRVERVAEAEEKALSYKRGYTGAMFPWESAATGVEVCPTWASTGQLEQHITGDIAFATQQYWYASRNTSWLDSVFPSLLSKTADFWVSRVEMEGSTAHIRHVIPPDEYATADDSVYTNFVAQRNLVFAAEAASALGKQVDQRWLNVSAQIPILFDAKQGIHPEFSGYSGQKIKQADVVLLGFPLMMNMSEATRRADLDYYADRTDGNGPAMTWGMHAVGYLELGDAMKAASNFNRSFANAQPPFYVWTETPTGGAVNFLTGVGGFLQTTLFGLGGLRIHDDHLALNPSLIEGMTSVVVRGVHYRGTVFALSFTEDSMTLRVDKGHALAVADAAGKITCIAVGSSKTFSRGKARVRAGTCEELVVV